MTEGRGYLTALMIACAVSTAVGAQLKFSIGPVPFTAQNFGFVLAGLLLPPSWAAGSQLLYLLMIAVGFPVAAGLRGGIHVLIGYTAGYLWSFPVAAALMSALSRAYLKRRKVALEEIGAREYSLLLAISLVAAAPVYLVGFIVFYLYAITPAYGGLLSWAREVSGFVGLWPSSPVIACFLATTLIFIPQDLFMDHAAAIVAARLMRSLLRARGVL